MDCVHFTLCVSIALQFRVGPLSVQTEAASLPDVSNLLTTICPNFQDCPKDEIKSFNGSFPVLFCCLFCSCEASCVEQHSCCPGSPHASDDVISYISRRNDAVCRNTLYSGKPKHVYLHAEYEFIETCLDNADETTKQKCENMARTNDSVIHDHIPVYDPQRGRSYANIHCAKCNIGSTADVIVWQPKMTCDDDVDLQVISTNIDLGIREYNCEVIFVPPDGIADIPPCFNDVITECNVTGDLAVYDDMDAYFCQELDMLYVSIVNQTRKYRNIFCAKCNGENINIMFPTQCPYKQTQNTNSGITTLIKYTLSDVERAGGAVVNENLCPRSYTYDPLTEECKQLLCSPPFYFDVTTSTCQLFHQTVTNVNMLLSYYLKFDTILQFEDMLPIVEDVYIRIRRNRDIFACAIGIYYQTDIEGHANNLSQSISFDNITVMGIYLLIYTSILDTNPQEAYISLSELFASVLSVNTSEFTLLGSDKYDLGMFIFDDIDDVINLQYEEFTYFPDGRPSHYLFKNPYDNTVILGHIDNTNIVYCLPNIYKTDFIDCPALIYDFIDDFRRVADGLAVSYKTSEILFRFHQFKTASSSTVRICSQAVNDRMNQVSHSSSLPYDLTCARFILVFLLLSTTIP